MTDKNKSRSPYIVRMLPSPSPWVYRFNILLRVPKRRDYRRIGSLACSLEEGFALASELGAVFEYMMEYEKEVQKVANAYKTLDIKADTGSVET